MKPIDKDSPHQAIIGEELRLLARVSAALSELSSRTHGAPDFDNALISLRDQIAEAKPEDIGPLVEQMTRISALAQRYGKGRDLPVSLESPYFAHLQLLEDEQRSDVLIGKHGYVDRKHGVKIVDWRNAPVSRIYYRYEEGDDYEEQFGQTVREGEIIARRSLTIDNARLRRIACPQGTFIADEQGRWYEAAPVSVSQLSGGQGVAARPPVLRLGRRGSRLGIHSGPVLRADKHLPEIAALIDPVQFELITRPESGLVVLQGGAGSGKTTVALHRVAYLNFALPTRFRGERMLVVVLSEAMVRYVERVLPSLGVKGVPVMTARSWLRRARRKVLPQVPDRYNDDTPPVVTRFKKHPLQLGLTAAYVQGQLDQLEQQLSQSLTQAAEREQVLAAWREQGTLSPVARCSRLRKWIERQPLSGLTQQQAQGVLQRMTRRLRDIWTDWAELLSDQPLLEQAVAQQCPGEFSPRDLERICAWCSRQSEEQLQAAEQDKPRSRAGGGPSPDTNDPFISLDGLDERVQPVVGRLDPPDDALLLRLYQLKQGMLRTGGKPMIYEHLVVDEAQDLSAVEVKVLVEAGSARRSVTLAGDTAQRAVFDNAFSDWETLLEQIEVQAETNKTLRLGYRSTEEIMELARTLTAETAKVAEIQPVRRGTAVELHCFGDQGEAVAMLGEALRSLQAREPLASVALIARYPEQARAYAEALALAEVPGVRLVANQEFSFKAGIDVTDVSQVKGLEFDYVILLDVTAGNYPDTLESRHLLYIGATRAAHQLWLISPSRPSPILPRSLVLEAAPPEATAPPP